jgi:hypothetical protein
MTPDDTKAMRKELDDFIAALARKYDALLVARNVDIHLFPLHFLASFDLISARVVKPDATVDSQPR